MRFNILMGVPDIDRIGGYERQALKLTQSLLSQGHRVSILSNHLQTAKKQKREIWNVPVDRITAPDTLYGYAGYQACISRLYQELGRGLPLIVHCHAISDFTFTLLAAAQKLSIPTVLKLATQTDLIGLEQKGYYPKPIYKSGPRVREILQQVDAYISLNENLSEEIYRFLGTQERTKSYSNVIDVTKDLITSNETCNQLYQDLRKQGLRYAITTNRLEKRKQSFNLIQSWSQLPKELKDRWRLVVIGDGEESQPIQEFLKQTGETSVLLMGQQTGFLDLLNHADLFIFASQYEGNPNGLLEAIARGLRVLVTDIEGVGDCLPAVCQNQVFSLGKSEEIRRAEPLIRQALERVETNPLSDAEKTKIAQFCEELFGPERLIQNYTRLYKQLSELRKPAKWRIRVGAWSLNLKSSGTASSSLSSPKRAHIDRVMIQKEEC